MYHLLAAEGGAKIPPFQAGGFFLENVYIIPLIMAISFAVILFFGKRMPKGGSEVGIVAVGVCFVLALLTAGQWIGQVSQADGIDCIEDDSGHVVCEGIDLTDYEKDLKEADPDAKLKVLPDEVLEAASAPGAGEFAAASGGFAAIVEAPAAGDTQHPGAHAVVAKRTWWSNGGIDFTVGTMVDGLTVTLLVVVTLISTLVHIYSTDYVGGDRRYTHYFAFLSLFTAAMLFYVVSENVLQMIVGWELVGVCSFALIGHWWEEQKNSDAALKAFLTNRVGDIGLLIGMIVLFFASNEKWGIVDINSLAADGTTSHNLLLIASLCLLAAVMSKSGQFFLHTWLPDAMAGPTPVSALIHAATMVVAGIYLVARLYPVFFEGLSISGSSINALALIGAITTLVGASMAFVQDDIKAVLAYSTISQLGYMALALGVGAWTAGVFHLTTHAFFKALLFLGAGSVSHAVHSFNMKKDMGGMRKFMPTTYKAFLIGSIALAGLPPLAGFWSKDEVLVGTGGWGFFSGGNTGGNGAYTVMLVMGLITSGLTAAYMTRVIYLTFFGEFRGGHHDDHADDHAHAAADAHDAHDDHAHHGDPHESGPRILWPLRILAGLAVISGLMNLPKGFLGLPKSITTRFEHFVEPSGVPYFPKISHAIPSWSLAIFATAMVCLAAGAAYWYYFVKLNRQNPAATDLIGGPTERFDIKVPYLVIPPAIIAAVLTVVYADDWWGIESPWRFVVFALPVLAVGLLFTPVANQLVNPFKAGHTMLKNRYYLDHIYDGGAPVGAAGATAMATIFGAAAGLTLGFSLDNGLNQDFWPSAIWGLVLGATVFTIVNLALQTGVGIASFVKGRLAWVANWVHENFIDATVDTVGTTSVKSANFVYRYIDQGVIDGSVNAVGTGSSGAGDELRRWSTGQVQQYATVMFAGATLLAGLLIIVI